MTLYAYLRVSREDLNLENQKHALSQRHKINEFFYDTVSGAVPALERPGFQQALAVLRPGDTLLVVAIDRFGRDLLDGIYTNRYLRDRGIRLQADDDPTEYTLENEIFLAMRSYQAQQERQKLITRTKAGIARFRAQNGNAWGAGRKGQSYDHGEIQRLLGEGKTWSEVKQLTGCSHTTIARVVRKTRSTVAPSLS